MVRDRVRKTISSTTSAEVVEAAARSVVSREKSLSEAALDYKIPKTTLFRYVAKLKASTKPASVSFRPRYIRRLHLRWPGCLEQSAIIHSRTVQHRHFQTAP